MAAKWKSSLHTPRLTFREKALLPQQICTTSSETNLPSDGIRRTFDIYETLYLQNHPKFLADITLHRQRLTFPTTAPSLGTIIEFAN
ncbi:Hypothetical predicted protein [Olea europaea subsp. europaea]|uniref:Uncharacterized protein n=1 Tax=Olea europaea subsp. europaea TaxID=158383 RepID=A0A8S0RJG2_OLEEU|nr:Hypothetical predicted protein [Olea europaea subsp. europaea]